MTKATDIKKLRDLTGAGVMDVKNALQKTGGDFDKAVQILKQAGAAIAAQKAQRGVINGVVASYVHTGNKIGVLVEINVETDFVARDEKFIKFAQDLAMHIAGMAPKYVTSEEIPADELNPKDDSDAYAKEVCLLQQPYVKDQSKTVEDFLNEQIAHFKENIRINRFVRFELGLPANGQRDL